jgi:hypothetical protein
LVSFSIKSHLLIKTTTPFLFFSANQNIFWSWLSKPRVASTIKIITSEYSIERTGALQSKILNLLWHEIFF